MPVAILGREKSTATQSGRLTLVVPTEFNSVQEAANEAKKERFGQLGYSSIDYYEYNSPEQLQEHISSYSMTHPEQGYDPEARQQSNENIRYAKQAAEQIAQGRNPSIAEREALNRFKINSLSQSQNEQLKNLNRAVQSNQLDASQYGQVAQQIVNPKLYNQANKDEQFRQAVRSSPEIQAYAREARQQAINDVLSKQTQNDINEMVGKGKGLNTNQLLNNHDVVSNQFRNNARVYDSNSDLGFNYKMDLSKVQIPRVKSDQESVERSDFNPQQASPTKYTPDGRIEKATWKDEFFPDALYGETAQNFFGKRATIARSQHNELANQLYSTGEFVVSYPIGLIKGLTAPINPDFYKGLYDSVKSPYETFAQVGEDLRQNPAKFAGENLGFTKGFGVATSPIISEVSKYKPSKYNPTTGSFDIIKKSTSKGGVIPKGEPVFEVKASVPVRDIAQKTALKAGQFATSDIGQSIIQPVAPIVAAKFIPEVAGVGVVEGGVVGGTPSKVTIRKRNAGNPNFGKGIKEPTYTTPSREIQVNTRYNQDLTQYEKDLGIKRVKERSLVVAPQTINRGSIEVNIPYGNKQQLQIGTEKYIKPRVTSQEPVGQFFQSFDSPKLVSNLKTIEYQPTKTFKVMKLSRIPEQKQLTSVTYKGNPSKVTYTGAGQLSESSKEMRDIPFKDNTGNVAGFVSVDKGGLFVLKGNKLIQKPIRNIEEPSINPSTQTTSQIYETQPENKQPHPTKRDLFGGDIIIRNQGVSPQRAGFRRGTPESALRNLYNQRLAQQNFNLVGNPYSNDFVLSPNKGGAFGGVLPKSMSDLVNSMNPFKESPSTKARINTRESLLSNSRQGTSLSSANKQRNFFKERLNQRTTPKTFIDTMQNINQGIGQIQDAAQDVTQIPLTDVAVDSLQAQDLGQDTIPITLPKLDVQPISILPNEPIPSNIKNPKIDSYFDFEIYKPIKNPKRPEPFGPFDDGDSDALDGFLQFTPKSNNKKPSTLYNVLVREGGRKSDRFKPASSKPLPYYKALNLGADIVDNTTARTFKIIKSKIKGAIKDDSSFFKADKFRSPKGNTKLPAFSFVEKSRNAIDTYGELMGIPFASKNKRRSIV